MFAHLQLAFPVAAPVNQHPSQAVTGRATLAEAKRHQPAGPLKNFRGKLAAVFARHHPLHALDDGAYRSAVVLEVFRAKMDAHASRPADKFIMRAFVGVLKTSPPAHVINETG